MAAAGTFLSTFPTSITTCKGVDWSEDNRIAIPTDDGIFLLDMIVSPAHMDAACHFFHTNIPPSKDDPVSFIPFDFNKLSKSLPLGEVHSLMLDRTLCPKTGCQTSSKGYKAAVWSPAGGDILGRCVLATISHDHQLCIQSSSTARKTWKTVADLSSIYASDNKYSGELTFSVLKTFSYKLAAMELSWSDTMKGKDVTGPHKYSVLSVGMKNGDVVLWKIKLPCLQESDCTVLKVLSLHCEIVTSLAWCPYIEENNRKVLAVGYSSGQIHLVDLHLAEEVKVTPTCIFNDSDNLRVSCMCWRKLKLGGCLLLSSKEHCLIAHKVVTKKGLTAKQKAVGSGEHSMMGTGLCNRERLTALASADGTVQMVTITELRNKNEEIVMDFSRIEFPKDDRYAWTCHGVSLSSNGCFCAAVYSPSSSYCHLELREPLKIQIVHVGDTEYIHEYAGPLSHGLDVMEAYRQGITCEPDLLDLIREHRLNVTDLTEQPLKALKIYRFLFLTVDNLYQKSPNDSDEDFEPVSKDIEKFTSEIYKRLIEQRCEAVVKLKRKLTDVERQSLKQTCVFLEKRGLESPKKSGVLSKVKGLVKDTQPVTCPICEQSLVLEDDSYHCENGHQFAMCCQSLLVVDSVPYRKCQICGVQAKPVDDLKDIPFLAADINRCPLCEGLLV